MKPKESSRGTKYLGVIEPSWKQQAPSRLLNLIGGKFVDSQSFASVNVVNPATKELISQFPLTTNEEFKAAVFAAKRAYLSWRNTPISTRQCIMFKCQELIRRDIDKLVMSVTVEHGKILKDSYDDVLRRLGGGASMWTDIFASWRFCIQSIQRSRHVQHQRATWCLCWNLLI